MSLSQSQFDLVLQIFKLKRRRIRTDDDNDRDENDLRDVCTALEAASLVIIPSGTIEALKNTISELNGKLKKGPELSPEGASS